MTKKQKAWCYFCDKVFDSEVYLIDHQKKTHFRCPICRRQKINCKALVEHMSKVHQEILSEVPNAIHGRESPDNSIFGMKGIPDVAYIQWLGSVNPDFADRAKSINSDGAVLANNITRMASLAHNQAAHSIIFSQLNQFSVNINPGQSTIITAGGIVNSDAALQQASISKGPVDMYNIQKRYDAAMQKAQQIVEELMYQAEKERKKRAKEKAKNEVLYFDPPQNGLTVFELRAQFLREKSQHE